MLISYKRSQGSIILRAKILNSSISTGAGLTGLLFSSTGLRISTIADNESAATVYTVAGSTIETIATLGTYAAPTATKCRFKEVDATNHPGVVEIQLADARYAVASAKSLLVSISGATNAAECDLVIPLTDVNPYDAAAGGMTNLDAAVSTRATPAQVNTQADLAITANTTVIATAASALSADNKASSLLTNVAAIPAAILAAASEGAETVVQTLRLIRSAVVGKLSGAATTTISTRDAADTKNRITATVDGNGNRSAVTTDGT